MKLLDQDIKYWRNQIYSHNKDLGLINKSRSYFFVFSVFILNFISLVLIFFAAKEKNLYLIFASFFITGYSYYQYQFLLHEASHGTLFSSRKINDFFGEIFGVLSGYNFYIYRSNHMKHHKFLGSDLDPENGNFLKGIEGEATKILLKAFFGYDALKQIFSLFFKNKEINPKHKSSTITSLAIYASLTVVVSFFFSWDLFNIFLFLLLLVLPIFTLTFLLNRLRGIFEHPLGLEYKNFLFTVSHSEGFLWNYILASFNFNFHLEHHLVPEISSSHYPRINRFLNSQIGET